MTDFPEPPAWVPRPFPEVPPDYKPRKGDLVQNINPNSSLLGNLVVVREDWVGDIEGVGRVLILANPIPKTRKFTIEDEYGVVEFEGSYDIIPAGIPRLIVDAEDGLSGHVSIRRDGIETPPTDARNHYIRLDRPFRIERRGPSP